MKALTKLAVHLVAMASASRPSAARNVRASSLP